MYSIKQKICIAINSIELCSSIKAKELLELFDNTRDLVGNVDKYRNILLNILNDKQIEKLKNALTTSYLDYVMRLVTDNNIAAITYYCDNYPKKLCNIPDAPLVIYCKGNLNLLDSFSISVVGSRKNSPYGRRVTEYFVSQLVPAGVTIVSGLALGIDSISHQAALNNNGNTIAVLGSGFNSIYPPTNNSLAREIVQKNGLLLSEHLPDVQAQKFNFPKRNRIISALCDGLLVIEASSESGVFSTVDFALEQGKQLFVIPNDIFAVNSIGSNNIIKQTPAAVVTQPKDIIDFFSINYVQSKTKAVQLSINQQKIVDILKSGKCHYNEIASQAGLPLNDLSFLLAEMELLGYISKLPLNNYMLTEIFL